jgi:hypothetical protein
VSSIRLRTGTLAASGSRRLRVLEVINGSNLMVGTQKLVRYQRELTENSRGRITAFKYAHSKTAE